MIHEKDEYNRRTHHKGCSSDVLGYVGTHLDDFPSYNDRPTAVLDTCQSIVETSVCSNAWQRCVQEFRMACFCGKVWSREADLDPELVSAKFTVKTVKKQ